MLQYKDFIIQHRNDDPRHLALQRSRYPDIDIPYVVQQISAWQTARKKLPQWTATNDIVYPVHLSMEQCSSQATAEYKAGLIAEGERMTDLTAGFGVDATALGRKFRHLSYVERNAELCEIAQNNLPLLGISDFEVINADGTEILATLPHQSLIFLDPARRDSNGNKTISISDCTPDVTKLQDTLLSKADTVMIKLSPMLDIPVILKELKCVREIHVVSINNECKEIVVIQTSQSSSSQSAFEEARKNEASFRIVCTNLKTSGENVIAPAFSHTECFSFTQEEERNAECHYFCPNKAEALPLWGVGGFLYEPNTSIMKAACFKSLAQHYGITKLHPGSHLYISDRLIPEFPGRIFRIETVHSLRDKELKSIKKANITIRNFPSSVAELRKRMKIHEGGDIYLFATTLADESKVIIRCSKANSHNL